MTVIAIRLNCRAALIWINNAAEDFELGVGMRREPENRLGEEHEKANGTRRGPRCSDVVFGARFASPVTCRDCRYLRRQS